MAICRYLNVKDQYVLHELIPDGIIRSHHLLMLKILLCTDHTAPPHDKRHEPSKAKMLTQKIEQL